MDPVILIICAVLIGGLVLAFLLFRRRAQGDVSDDPFSDGGLSSDVINMARIRVAGVGGLGLVAMAVAVAWNVPRIGQTLAVGAILGVLFASGLILWRRRSGPMPSSSRSSGANTTLSIDAPAEPAARRDRPAPPLVELGPTTV